MIKWFLDEFLLILLLNIPYDCVKFISYASYRNNPRKEVKFWLKNKILVALDIKNWGFQLKRAGGGSRDKKVQQNLEKLIVDRWPGGQLVPRGWEFKKPPRASFLTFFSSKACRPFTSLLPEYHFGQILDRLQDENLILRRLEVRVLIWNPRFQLLGVFLLCTARLRVGSASFPWA